MNPELIKIAQQLMQQNPGMTPEQALRQAEQIIQRMSEGERSEDFVGGQAREAGRLGHMAQQQYEARQAQQQQQPGLLGGNQPTPQGQAPHPGIQPQQQQMRPNQLPIQQPQQHKQPKSAAQLCAESNGQMGQDGMCHYTFNY